MTKIKMASVAMDCHPRDKQVNIDKAIGYIEDAAAQGVNLIVFPEETITGFGTCGVREYSAEDKEYMHRACELVPEGNTTQVFIDQAKKHNMYIVFGIAEAEPDRAEVSYNTAVLVGPEGFVGKYRKHHLPVNERFYHYPGTGDFPVFDTEIGKIGLMICYDIVFPEVARILAVKGAQIICSPTCWPNMTHEDDSPTQLAYELYPTARAWENQVFFVVSNYAMIYAAGHSRIVGPGPLKGVLATTYYEEGMAVAEADIVEDIMKSRSDWTDGNDNLKDRKPGLYHTLVEPDPYTFAYGGCSPED